MVGNSAGHFCGQCPLVVLDRDEFASFVALAVQATDGIAFIVMGIVDLDAIPEDKRDKPFDDGTNPVPLVQFIDSGGQKPSSGSEAKRSSSRKRKKRKTKVR